MTARSENRHKAAAVRAPESGDSAQRSPFLRARDASQLHRVPSVQSAKQARSPSPTPAQSDGELRLGPTTPTVRTIRMAGKLDQLPIPQPQDVLELPADAHQDVLALFRGAALPARDVGVAAAGDALADGARPQADAVEALAHVDDDAHDLAVVVLLERLADGGQHRVQPELVDGDGPLLFEAVGPFAAVLVLRVFPFWSHAFFEEVVVGFQGQFRGRGDVVLLWRRQSGL